MMCYLDRQFCDAVCSTTSCDRKFTKKHEAGARQWWGGEGAPVAFGDMSRGCPDYTPASPVDIPASDPPS